MLRALIVALEAWVRTGIAPPDHRVPRIRDNTLVAPEQLAVPAIPGLFYRGLVNDSGERDFGARVVGNAGIIDKPFPDITHAHRVLVPQVDALGHDVAGIRHPFIEAPLATYLGWNTRTPEFGGDDLCDLLGSMIPLPATAAEAAATGDPRPALASLYADADAYAAKVETAARALVTNRLLLEEDVAPLVQEARAMFAARRR